MAWAVLIGPHLGADLPDPTIAGQQVGKALLASWCEPHRRYHNTTHLRHVLSIVDDLAAHATHPDAVRIAAWYHDAVYHGLPDDQEASAHRAETELHSLGVADDLVAEVSRLVRLTATHHPAPKDRNGAVLCDADLAILGSSPRSYAHYLSAVRAEYAHLPEANLHTDRTVILRTLLITKDSLFNTPRARLQWETTARTNLRTELLHD